MPEPCRIIGVLDNGAQGLTAANLGYIEAADVVIGGKRTLNLLINHYKDKCEQQDLTGKLSQVPQWIMAAQNTKKSCVVLATGDPLCYGIATFIIKKLGPSACEIHPNISTLQLLCARLGIAWQTIKICSVHGKDSGEWFDGASMDHGLYPLLREIQQHSDLAIFTSPENTPARIARMLINNNMSEDFRMAVAARLLCEDEQIYTQMTLKDAAQTEFLDPNIVLLQRRSTKSLLPLFGLRDAEFQQRKPDKGLITKSEVRAISLAQLQLRLNSIVWDIGAGSGSVGLEAARLCSQGHVFAIEKNLADISIIKLNREKFTEGNYSVLHAKAPEGLADWPDPDAIFIGGSGGELAELITLCLRRLKTNGNLVMNFVTVENLSAAIETLKVLNAQWQISQIQVSRSKPILHMNRFSAENPVWIVSAQQPVAEQRP